MGVGHEQDRAWCILKEIVSNETVLKVYDPKKPIRMSSDASKAGLAAVLQQYNGNDRLPLACASK